MRSGLPYLTALLMAFVAFGLGGCRRPEPPNEIVPPPATPLPVATPSPAPYVPNKKLETGRIFNGLQYRVTLETEYGESASIDREDPSSYSAELFVKVKVPKPRRAISEISRLNEALPSLLPALPRLIESAKVSPFFDELYRLKVANLRTNLNRLDNLISRHNFFDTETILELQDPGTKRRALFVQSDMDVDEDGSDSDRVPEVDGSSVTFQPFTSYKWDKKTENPNSFTIPRETKIRQYEQELAGASVVPARAKELKEAIARLKSEIADLKKYSFLVAATDPFVVIPGSMFGKSKGAYAPSMGDYCVVIFGSVLYPAIIGDVGPSYKSGESSLRICKQINSRASTNNRPVNELKVSYLIFPGTADKPFGPPDLEKWRTQCAKFLEELGGYKGELFAWEDMFKPPPPLAEPPPVAPSPAAPATP